MSGARRADATEGSLAVHESTANVTPAAERAPDGSAAPVRDADAWPARLRQVWRRLREGGALMVGVPDYDRYVAHLRAAHPELVPLTREAFVRARMDARYGGKGTGKCPC